MWGGGWGGGGGWGFFFSSRRRHTRSLCDWSSDVCLPILLCFGDLRSDLLLLCVFFFDSEWLGDWCLDFVGCVDLVDCLDLSWSLDLDLS